MTMFLNAFASRDESLISRPPPYGASYSRVRARLSRVNLTRPPRPQRRHRKMVPGAPSLDAHAPFPDQLAPFLDFFFEVRREFLGRARDHVQAHLREPRRELGGAQRGLQLRVQQGDDLRGRSPRREHPVPGAEFVSRRSEEHTSELQSPYDLVC